MARTRSLLVVGFLLSLLATPGSAAAAPCDTAGADASAIASARAAIDLQCDCAGAPSHGAYVSCARDVLKALAQGGALRKSCTGAVQRCAARSTCGKPGAVTCCRTDRNGITRAALKNSADSCRAPAGGSACVGSYASLCDACGAGGCTPRCGNGIVEAGEACEPPGTATCDATCQTIEPEPACGNGVIDDGEACDGTTMGVSCSPNSVCGAPGETMACQCCSRGASVFFNVYAEPYDPAPCCTDGDFCDVYAPHFCSCE